MKYAPVVIPTLCRDIHLARALESLAANSWAYLTDVYIVLDYPPSESYVQGYRKVCSYLDAFDSSCFKSFTVLKRDQNYGPGLNAIDALDNVIAPKYDRWIFSEDDLEFAPNFIEYMDKCLEAYEDDEAIQAVCGYSYPLEWKHSDGVTAFLTQATYSAWGTGQWREKSRATREAIKEKKYLLVNAKRAFDTGIVDKMINGRKAEYIAYVAFGSGKRAMEQVTDVSIGPYLTLSGKSVVVPIVSKVRNNGFDGSGINCSGIESPTGKHSLDYDYANQPFDQSDSFNLVEESDDRCVVDNNRLLNDFLYVPPRIRQLQKLGESIYFHFGIKGCMVSRRTYLFLRKIYRTLKRIK